MIEKEFPLSLSAPALSYQTVLGLIPALQQLHPTVKAVPLCATRGFIPGRGRLLSWAF